MAVVRTSNLFKLGGLASHNVGGLSAATSTSQRYSSADGLKKLESMSATPLRRGRGGRSSFSGITCTIFGAYGFMGTYIASKLGKVGTQVVLPYRGDFYDARIMKTIGDYGQVLFSPYHLLDEASIEKAVKYSDVVINLVGRDWATLNFSMHQVNVEGVARIAKVCKRMGVKRFVHLSALNCDREHEGVYGHGGSEFLKTKWEGELAVREEFPDAIIFRPSDVWGTHDRFLTHYGAVYRYDGAWIGVPHRGIGVYKQPVYVGDVAQGIANVVTKDLGEPGQVYQCVGPRQYEMHELIQWFLRVLRRTGEHLPTTTIVEPKYNPLQLLKIKLNQYMTTEPINAQTMDKLEREAVTDVVDYRAPTLEDLDVNLTTMEDRVEWELRYYRKYFYYDEQIGTFDKPAPPKYIEP